MVSTKNRKSRTISLAPSVINVLRRIKAKQLENRLRYGACWENSGFVFTDDLGNHLSASSVYKAFKRDVYGHVTEKMKQESAARMEQFIKAVNK